ncbi:CRISPR-associated protein Cas4 [Clostridia bacterium]|nr:CRISPR-associated protein Cas4 [Clostridia bacterium]
MEYAEEDYLQISGLQHFSYCKRQWAIIHVEKQWIENYFTADGRVFHENVHDPFKKEKRNDLIISRAMPVYSRSLGINGECDVVEFHASECGVSLVGQKGLWLPLPIEYKRGKGTSKDSDALQLCAQAICLEEMLACPPIETAYLFYGEPYKRSPVALTEELREKVKTMILKMHEYYQRGHTPKVKPSKSCRNCSMENICLANIADKSANNYVKAELEKM